MAERHYSDEDIEKGVTPSQLKRMGRQLLRAFFGDRVLITQMGFRAATKGNASVPALARPPTVSS
jgi:hypothetical protein